jgi:hypothetical protein
VAQVVEMALVEMVGLEYLFFLYQLQITLEQRQEAQQ